MKAFNGNLDEIANAMKSSKQTMTDLSFDTRNIVGFGTEDKVIGTVFGMKDGNTSQPLAGNAAAFIIKLNALHKAGKMPNYNAFVSSYMYTFKQRVQQDYPYLAIKAAANIQDNRILFY